MKILDTGINYDRLLFSFSRVRNKRPVRWNYIEIEEIDLISVRLTSTVPLLVLQLVICKGKG